MRPGTGSSCRIGACQFRISARQRNSRWCQPPGRASLSTTAKFIIQMSCVVRLHRKVWSAGQHLTLNSSSKAMKFGGRSFSTDSSECLPFLIWDREKNKAFIVRDRIGVKPLYFTSDTDVFACASDLRALSSLGFCEAIDRDALALYLMLGYVPTPRSIFRDVHKLEPGTFLEWSGSGALRQKRYWSAPTDTDYEEREPISDLIDRVVEEQLLSDVPIGPFLSGGIDSSVIASSIARLNASKTADLTALSIADPGRQQDNEAPVAKRTADALGIDFVEMPLERAEDFSYETATRAVDEPLGYTALVSQCAISKLAADRGLKCVLTGDGGDEVFGGYRWCDGSTVDDFVERRPDTLKRRLKSFTPRGLAARRDSRIGQEFRRQSPLAFHASRVFPALRPDQVAAMAQDISEAHATDLMMPRSMCTTRPICPTNDACSGSTWRHSAWTQFSPRLTAPVGPMVSKHVRRCWITRLSSGVCPIPFHLRSTIVQKACYAMY